VGERIFNEHIIFDYYMKYNGIANIYSRIYSAVTYRALGEFMKGSGLTLAKSRRVFKTRASLYLNRMSGIKKSPLNIYIL